MTLMPFAKCPGDLKCMNPTCGCTGTCDRTKPHAFSYVKARPYVCAICQQLNTHPLHAGRFVIEIPE